MKKIFNRSKAKRRVERLGLYTKPTREEVKKILNNPRYCVVDKEFTNKILDELF